MLQRDLNLKALRRPQVLAAAGIVLLAAVVVYLYMGRADAKDALSGVRADIAQRQQDIPLLTLEFDDLQIREAELEEALENQTPLPDEPKTTFPSRTDALATGAILTEYITGLQIGVSLFNSEQASETFGTTSYSAIRYSLSLRGPMLDLLGVLDLVERTPAALVKALSLSRDQAGAALWVMGLSFTVPYE
ncbi:MAG: hypothetical protein FJ317_00490 [SAR202 cluster bacterium]|nr:hypothetical protein [SAR202 cluster bacterium]